MRNRLIHEYFGTDLPVVWNVIKMNCPLSKLNCKGYIETYLKADKQDKLQLIFKNQYYFLRIILHLKTRNLLFNPEFIDLSINFTTKSFSSKE